MKRQTLIEAQHELHLSDPGYGRAKEGMHVCDLDESRLIDPAERGLSIDIASIEGFMVDQGGDPEHLKYATIGLFGPDSPDRKIREAGKISTRTGFVNPEWLLTDENGGVRFPNIGLGYGGDVTEDSINQALRHEIGHLLLPERTPLYGRRELITRLRLGMSAITGALLTTIPDTLNGDNFRHLLYEGYSPLEISAVTVGIGAAALVGTVLSSRGGSHSLLVALDKGERHADAFAAKHADFNPIKFV